MPDDDHVDFHPIEWEALKRRFAKTEDGYLFHLDDVGELMHTVMAEKKIDCEKFKTDPSGLGGRLQTAVDGDLVPRVLGKEMDKIPLSFVGKETIRSFEEDALGFKFAGMITVPAFRKRGNRTMYNKLDRPFPV